MRRRRGYLLLQFAVVVAVVSLLVAISAQRRLQRVREARGAYLEAAALALAQSGVEATQAALLAGQEPLAAPLGASVALSGGVGSLSVATSRTEDRVEVVACSRVEARAVRAHRAAVERCVEAAVDPSDPTRVLSWWER